MPGLHPATTTPARPRIPASAPNLSNEQIGGTDGSEISPKSGHSSPTVAKPQASPVTLPTSQSSFAAKQDDSMLKILLQLLSGSGFTQTAKILQQEANMDSGPLPQQDLHKMLAEPDAMKKLTPTPPKGQDDSHHDKMTKALDKMGKQSEKLKSLHGLIKSLNETASQPAVFDSPERDDAEVQEEIDRLNMMLKAQDDNQSHLARELRETQEELQKLKHLAKSQSGVALTSCPSSPKIVSTHEVFDTTHGPSSILQEVFTEVDANHNGLLDYRSQEVHHFIRRAFARCGIVTPSWPEEIWQALVREAGVDISSELNLFQASRLAHHCWKRYHHDHPNAPPPIQNAEIFARSGHYTPPIQQHAIVYSSGATVNCFQLSQSFGSSLQLNKQHRPRMLQVIESGDHIRDTLKTYTECDADGNGHLTWHNGEIQNFVAHAFTSFGLAIPAEDFIYHMYKVFDRDESSSLDARECLELVDAVFRTMFIDTEHQGPPQGPQQPPGAQRRNIHHSTWAPSHSPPHANGGHTPPAHRESVQLPMNMGLDRNSGISPRLLSPSVSPFSHSQPQINGSSPGSSGAASPGAGGRMMTGGLRSGRSPGVGRRLGTMPANAVQAGG